MNIVGQFASKRASSRTFGLTAEIDGEDYSVVDLKVQPPSWRLVGPRDAYTVSFVSFIGLTCDCRGFLSHMKCKHAGVVAGIIQSFCIFSNAVPSNCQQCAGFQFVPSDDGRPLPCPGCQT